MPYEVNLSYGPDSGGNILYGMLCVFVPPVAGVGQFAGIATKGLELLVETFPSDSYKQRK